MGGVRLGCSKQVGGVRLGCSKQVGGVRLGCSKQVGGVRLGCSKQVGGVRLGCSKQVGGVRLGCSQQVGGVQLGCVPPLRPCVSPLQPSLNAGPIVHTHTHTHTHTRCVWTGRQLDVNLVQLAWNPLHPAPTPGTLPASPSNQQVLDSLPVERERGITVKAQVGGWDRDGAGHQSAAG